MIVRRGRGDLNKIYRPCRIDEVVGHKTAKRVIKNAIEGGTLPHSLLFTGPSGCGKTTFARIIALGLNCAEGPTADPCCKCHSCKSILSLNSLDVIEVDAGRAGDVNHTRQVLNDLPSAPMGGRCRVAIFDEAHLLGSPSKSEEAVLKFLEDTPEHVYIILCTNEPQKLKDVTINRCKKVQFGRLTNDDIYQLLEQVCQFEGYEYNSDILRYIAKESNGVPRASLSFLQQVAAEGTWSKEAASLVINAGVDIDHIEVIALAKSLIQHRSFKEAVSLYKKINNIPIEIIRMGICGYFVGCLKNAKNFVESEKFSEIVDIMSEPYFSNPKPEHRLINSFYKITRILNK
jgi:DNA polymerase III subunit gamma/tau